MQENTIAQLIEYAANSYCNSDEKAVVADYHQAIIENNADKIAEFEAFGPSIRHRIMNMNQYKHQVRFGFYHTTLSEYNWLERAQFECEVIEFRVNEKEYHPSNIILGESPNGLWTYGVNFNFGYAGHYSGVSVFASPLKTRDEAFNVAIAQARKEYNHYLNQDGENRSPDYVKSVLKVIESVANSRMQLSLF
jgi:hypothetical protein